jgi:hypothetical protein
MKMVSLINRYFILVLGLLCHTIAIAQLEGLRMETYYITDADDATDTLGGFLEEGSVTYRIYVNLAQGSKLLGVYGRQHHPLIMMSEYPFFNHKEDGISFGKDLSRNRLETGTIPLDSYLTLGQCSRSFSGSAYFGIPKEMDADGSVIGGANNDGGSAMITGGLLKNTAPEAGMPLTTSDGFTVMSALPGSWVDIGFVDITNSTDTTIFGSAIPKSVLNSTNALLRNSGVYGADLVQNEVLLAQLTTKGEISFELNLEVEEPFNGSGKIVKYVARNEFLDNEEIFHPLLKYPYECGCTDPNYLEASTTFACTDNSKCLTPAILGCTDSLACNYDPAATYHIQDICCYIGYCHDRDISIACPNLEPREDFNEDQVKISPNPAYDHLELTIGFVFMADIHWSIVDLAGRPVVQGILRGQDRTIPIHSLAGGYYALQLQANGQMAVIPFVKI